ncbi:MAG TPA: TspO/MBR family protein [candidate division Zixibacteria bacterium]|nr:TspO/MBR family protein [candidate division Zixibacteria bacterium]
MSPERRQSVLVLIGFVAIAVAAELIASWLTAQSVGGWYTTIRKPSWTPPGWVFGPVWTVLYLSIGVSAGLVWLTGPSKGRRTALIWWSVQLLLNVIWSGLFFTMQNPALAFVEIVLLGLAIIATIVAFMRVRRAAGLLLVPYLLWVLFATALNFSIYRLNA